MSLLVYNVMGVVLPCSDTVTPLHTDCSNCLQHVTISRKALLPVSRCHEVQQG